MLLLAITLAGSLTIHAKDNDQAPAPVMPIPTEHQVRWQQMETYAFVHFGLNTFNDREWGYGDCKLETFNPTRLDCEQWAQTFVKAGLKGVIITAKHHDGFCLWPTNYTDYSIRNTPYKDGKGDVVGELAAACKKYGLKFGVYLSPWDRHQAFYGTPFYVDYFYHQLRELFTRYGDIFEIWFDGANGGDGWYGGAKDTRTIDRRTYYQYDRAYKLIDELQPQCIVFSDGGPGCRWVGNERGYAHATNWSFLRQGEVFPGYEKYYELQQGHADGNQWVPAECDVSIRPGWFYHEREDNKVKSVDHLTDLYYRSVGHNANLLINFPVNKEGRIHPTDSARIIAMHQRVTNELADNLLRGARIKASEERGRRFGVKALTDNRFDTYWATHDSVRSATLSIRFRRATRLNRLLLQEYIPLGQRVKSFTVEYRSGKQWLPIRLNEETTTIGYKRLLRFKPITTRQLRIRFNDARGCLCISEIGAYHAPNAQESFELKEADLKGYAFTQVSGTAENEVLMDLGQSRTVSALHYQPAQKGIATHYEILVGADPSQLRTLTTGEFSNIRNNPIRQDVYLTPTHARYIMLRALRIVDDSKRLLFDKLVVR
nr:alpha-L-fucosidase [Hoylesella buccalis]